MAVVVTGASGFVGSHLVDALVTGGRRVVAVDRQPPAPPQPGVTALAADLLDRDPAVEAALRDAEAVFHLAGCPGVRDARPDADMRRHRDNVLATGHVLRAVPARTPVVVTSSSSVYGGTHDRPSGEADPLRPRGGYARSKVVAEQLCAQRASAGGRVVVARPFTVLGERQRPDMALARWIAAAAAGLPLEVHGSPARTRDVTDVADVVRVLVALADSDARGAVNVGTGVPHSLGEMVAAVAAALDADVRVRVVPAHPDDVADTRADTRRLAALLEFVPATDLAAVVARQVAATPPAVASTLAAAAS